MFKGNMNKIMKQAKEMQDKMMQTQKEIESMEIEGNSGGGAVKVKLNGKKEIISVRRYGALKAFTSAFIGLFSGDIDKLNKHYTIHKKKEPRMWRVGLKPKDKTIRELLKGIIVSGSSRSPETVQIFHSSGDLTSLKITNRRSINESEERKLFLDLRFEQ